MLWSVSFIRNISPLFLYWVHLCEWCLCLCPYTDLVLFDDMGHHLSAARLQAFIRQRLKAHLMTVEDCRLEEHTGKNWMFLQLSFLLFVFCSMSFWCEMVVIFLIRHGHKLKYWRYNSIVQGHKLSISWPQMIVLWLKKIPKVWPWTV